MKLFKSKSIGATLTFAITFMMIVTMLISSCISYFGAKNVLEKEIKIDLGQLATTVASYIDVFTESNFIVIEAVSANEVLHKAGNKDEFEKSKNSIVKFLADTKKRSESLAVLRYIVADKSGNGFDSSGSAVDISKDVGFTTAIQNKRFVLPNIMNTTTKKPETTYYIPLKDNSGTIVGVLAAVADGMKLREMTNRIDIRSTGKPHVLQSDAGTLAYRDASFVETKDNVIERARTNPKLAELAALAQKQIKGESGVGSYGYEGVEKYLGYAPISKYGWTVAVAAPYDEVFAGVYNIKYTLIITSVVLLLLAWLFTLIISKKVIKPFAEVNKLLNRYSGLDFTYIQNNELDKIRTHDDEPSHILNDTFALKRNVAKFLSVVDSGLVTFSDSSNKLDDLSRDSKDSAQKANVNMQTIISDLELDQTNLVRLTEVGHEIAEGSERSAEAATKAAEIFNITSQSAKAATKTVEDALSFMSKVEEDIEQASTNMDAVIDSVAVITGFVTTIQSIADQTNLLALNAAIEAARAGEVGRGFAVVADEVRKLAEESSVAALEISKRITVLEESTQKAGSSTRSIKEEIGGITTGAKEVRGALADVNKQMVNANDVIQDVAASAQESSAGTREMTSALQTLKDSFVEGISSAREASVLVEQTADSSVQVSAEATALTSSTGQLSSFMKKFSFDKFSEEEVAAMLDELKHGIDAAHKKLILKAPQNKTAKK